MIFEKLILDNFLTYEHLEYDFENRPLLIQGRNLTDEGQKSNGSGKSGIQSGIEFAITASNSRDVRDAELISYGQKESRVQLVASCNVRKERIHIDWIIKLKGSNLLTITKQKFNESWEEVSFSNVNDGKKWILTWFAISKEDLFNYYIINNTRFKSFFKSSNREKVDLINRFSDASIVTGIENVDTNDLQKDYSKLQTEIEQLNGKIELTEENLTKEKQRDFEAELAEEADELEEDIEEIEGKIELEQGYIVELGPTKVALEEDIQEQKDEKEELKEEKEDKEADIEHHKTLLKEINKDVEEAKKQVDNFVKTDWNAERKDYEEDIKSDKKNLRTERGNKRTLEDQESKILKALQNIDVKLSGSITCPKCSHEFLLDAGIDELKEKSGKLKALQKQVDKKKEDSENAIKQIKESINDLEESISQINSKERDEMKDFGKLTEAVNSLSRKVTQVERTINKLKQAINNIDKDINNCDSEISKIELEISGLSQVREKHENNIKTFYSQIDVISAQIRALKPKDNKTIIKGLESSLTSYKNEVEEKSGELSELGDEIYERNQWANNFKQFRMYLANQSLEAIEFHNNRYLNDMGSDLRVKLDGFKVLANGSIKEEITAKIIRGQERSFGSFSGGERGRLLFASILANRHMINSTHPYGGLDFLSIDEVFEGVDGVGLKKLIRSAKKLNITVMIITHVTDEETTHDILTVEKVNGVSRVITN